MTQTICRKNKFGYCKYDKTCRYKHVDEECDDENCDVYKCEKRHPRTCSYMRDHGRCKFTTYCKYNHKKVKNTIENTSKIAAIEKEISELKLNLQIKSLDEEKTNERFDMLDTQN